MDPIPTYESSIMNDMAAVIMVRIFQAELQVYLW